LLSQLLVLAMGAWGWLIHTPPVFILSLTIV
jgi:hypothetical protein